MAGNTNTRKENDVSHLNVLKPLRKEYESELDALRVKMLKAQSFAEKIPAFANFILDNKLTEDQSFINWGCRYKDLWLGHDIYRHIYSGGDVPLNYKGTYEGALTRIYINSYTLFDTNDHFGLELIAHSENCFWHDELNAIFYATDDKLEGLMNDICDWYQTASQQAVERRKAHEIDALKARLARLEQ
jgi:hypothetical protein